jgi:hypothetical protein
MRIIAVSCYHQWATSFQVSKPDGFTERVYQNEIAFVEFVLDIKTLLEQGKSNSAIREELELSSSFSDNVIDFLRLGHQDLL